nr:myb/SANT-like domain-containing protein [Tanacetum cinerariifolium]
MEDSPKDKLENNHKKKKSRVGWKSISVVKMFMEACIHAIALDGREGVNLNKNKLVKPLKSTSLYFPELYTQLFDGTMATDIKSYGTSSHEPTRVVEPHVIEDDKDIGTSGTTSQKPHSKVKENPKKDKIESKPDKNRKRGEAGKSQKQLQ